MGDALVGVPSSGIHSNGLTLARRIIDMSSYTYHDFCPYDPRKTLGDDLLTPTRIYMEIMDVIRECDVHGLAHITGSGLLKLRRITRYGFNVSAPLEPQPIFRVLQEKGGVDAIEMYRTFNMGMGFLIVLPRSHANRAAEITGGSIVGGVVESGIKVKGLEIG